MASQWLHGEARRAMMMARSMAKGSGGTTGVNVYLHFRRGELKPSLAPDLEGYDRVTRIALPMDKTDAELLEWLLWELKSVPCHPVRG